MLERETRREKILESKLRELKLRVRTAQKHEDDEDSKRGKLSESEIACSTAEKEFCDDIEVERDNRNPNSINKSTSEKHMLIKIKILITKRYDFIGKKKKPKRISEASEPGDTVDDVTGELVSEAEEPLSADEEFNNLMSNNSNP